MEAWVDLAVKLIAPFEGCERRRKDGLIYPYLDTLAKPPVWTRGYGRTYGIDENSPAITKQEALQELKDGVAMYGKKVLKYSPVLIKYPECFAAVVSWCWNCGTGLYSKSRLRRAINEGRWEDASELIRKPNTAGGIVYRGLTRRREAERALFLLGMPTDK